MTVASLLKLYEPVNVRNSGLLMIKIICPRCDGQGWVPDTGSAHGCNGTDEDCQNTCPVPVLVQKDCGLCLEGKTTPARLKEAGYSNFKIFKLVDQMTPKWILK